MRRRDTKAKMKHVEKENRGIQAASVAEKSLLDIYNNARETPGGEVVPMEVASLYRIKSKEEMA